MNEISYLISEASQLVNVEAHVLRYWEDELELKIPRNDLGHRYYTEEHIELFRKVKHFKEEGYQLRAIKSNLQGDDPDGGPLEPLQESVPVKGDKLVQFQKLMTEIVSDALSRNNDQLSKNIGNQVSDKVVKEMDYLMRMSEEQQEERFKRLDEAIRSHQKDQKVKSEVAATVSPERNKKQHKFFKRKKKQSI